MTRVSILSLVLAATAFAACEPPPIPDKVVISPSIANADVVGATVQYTAQVIDDMGETIVGAEITWSSAAPDVATISASGLATVTGQGTTSIRANHQSVYGGATLVVELAPARLTKLRGDALTVPALSLLPEDPTVRVEDGGGAPIPGVEVAFEVTSGDGQIAPLKRITDSSGEAFTRWTLGEPTGTQTLRASASSFQAEFSVTATTPLLAIRPTQLHRARVGLDYRRPLEIIGGTPPVSWSVSAGSLPAGLMLDTVGVVHGVPAEEGSSTFTAHVRDADGNEASRELDLRVCEGPLQLESGDVVEVNSARLSACPPFIPAGEEGDRYRVGVVRTAVSFTSDLATVVVTVTENDADGGPAAQRTALARARPALELPPALAEGLRLEDESARLHATLLARFERLMAELGPESVLPDMRGASPNGALAAARLDPPPDRMIFRPYDRDRASQGCQLPAPETVPALLVDYNDFLAIYQDSAQQVADPIDMADARQVLDYYEAYGVETIDEYFGGVSDINGDGRVNVFVSPAADGGIAAFVWGADFLDAAQCSWSNEMELVYFNEAMFDALAGAPEDGHYQALGTMVHEMKHVSSLYRRSVSAGGFQPSWAEEGTAEIAGEISSRRAMEAAGGVARGTLLTRDAYPPRDGSIITPENYAMLLRLARTTLSYNQELNSVTTNPTPGHSYYGTSWHFHRFLGDAYGDAAEGADGAFFTALNDTTVSSGPAGMLQLTGTSIQGLLVEYTAAMMLNGTGAPEPKRTFRTYDFPSATFELFRPDSQPEGLYPWPHTGATPVGFDGGTYAGNLAAAGIRFHDFESDGQGDGIEVDVSVTGGTVRVVIARVR